MAKYISVVINTFNEEKNISNAIESVKWADEVVVCDMYSEDKTVAIAKTLGARVISHKRLDYVEPARNFAISKASNEWVLILDPDEEIPDQLAKRLKEIANKMNEIDYVRIPRKNIIFGKWVRAAMWWPDYNIRFFKKGKVVWGDKIHRPPKTEGAGLDLPDEEKFAIVHHNYQTVSQFINRMDRYTTIEAKQLLDDGYKFEWRDLLRKPLSEFLSRFFANRGYENGLHGLALSFLQAFSFLVTYLKIWELSGFKESLIEIAEIDEEKKKAAYSTNYWINQVKRTKNPFKDFFQRLIK